MYSKRTQKSVELLTALLCSLQFIAERNTAHLKTGWHEGRMNSEKKGLFHKLKQCKAFGKSSVFSSAVWPTLDCNARSDV